MTYIDSLVCLSYSMAAFRANSFQVFSGSADAERCFSVMNGVIGQRRHGLASTTVDDIGNYP